MLVGTVDTVFDTKPAPYRILHQTPSSEVFYGACTSIPDTKISYLICVLINYTHPLQFIVRSLSRNCMRLDPGGHYERLELAGGESLSTTE